MRFLIFFPLACFLPSVVTASPILQASSNDNVFLDLFPSLQQVNSDTISFNPSNLDDASENLFSNANLDLSNVVDVDPNDDDPLSSDSFPNLGSGLSSSGSLGLETESQLQSQLNLFEENAGPIAFSTDTSLLPPFSINQDSSFNNDPSLDGTTLISSVVRTAQAGPPACSSLSSRNSNVAFQPLCCESPCMDIQSWRRSCRSCKFSFPPWFFQFMLRACALLNEIVGDSSCPESQVACCQQFNVSHDNSTQLSSLPLSPSFFFNIQNLEINHILLNKHS